MTSVIDTGNIENVLLEGRVAVEWSIQPEEPLNIFRSECQGHPKLSVVKQQLSSNSKECVILPRLHTSVAEPEDQSDKSGLQQSYCRYTVALLICLLISPKSQNYRRVWDRRDVKDHLVLTCLKMDRDTLYGIRLLKAPSNLFLKTSGDPQIPWAACASSPLQ